MRDALGGDVADRERGRSMSAQSITAFITHHFRHFNAAALIDAAEAYKKHVEGGGQAFRGDPRNLNFRVFRCCWNTD